MNQHSHLYINGEWRLANGDAVIDVLDSFTERSFASYRTASTSDVDDAVRAARKAFESWSARSVAFRTAAVRRIADALEARTEELAVTISREVGMPRKLAQRLQVSGPIAAWRRFADLGDRMKWEEEVGHSLVVHAPKGVVACITPWNYPLHQITGKIAPALVAGCCVVLKPSEIAPSSAFLLAHAVEEAELPPGVFNLVHGIGSHVGEALASHPHIDMVSFTGSTRSGQRIASLAGERIKRISLELGGKSPAVVLPEADLAAAVKSTLASCLLNSGQTCSATTRLLVPKAQLSEVESLLVHMLPTYLMGDPAETTTRLGPLVSSAHRGRVLAMIDEAVEQGARPLTSVQSLPLTGFFVAPTVLMDVEQFMAVAKQEVFGPVLAVVGYDDVEQAIGIANATEYGLAATVWGPSTDAALAVARRIRSGQVDINGAAFNPIAPFGGFKQSGIGRENGQLGIAEYLEPISIQLPKS